MNIYLETKARLEAMEAKAEERLAETRAAGLSLKQMSVLDALYCNTNVEGWMHASELAKAINVAATSFTPVLDILQGHDLIKRKPDPNDRRAVRIVLTKKSTEIREDIQVALEEIELAFAPKPVDEPEPVPV